jgi:hypothetical protein
MSLYFQKWLSLAKLVMFRATQIPRLLALATLGEVTQMEIILYAYAPRQNRVVILPAFLATNFTNVGENLSDHSCQKQNGQPFVLKY